MVKSVFLICTNYWFCLVSLGINFLLIITTLMTHNGRRYETCRIAGLRPYPLWQKHEAGRNDLKATEAGIFYECVLCVGFHSNFIKYSFPFLIKLTILQSISRVPLLHINLFSLNLISFSCTKKDTCFTNHI